ncbi:Metalloendopeptidase [Mycena kentingensis (nom. inval.)]|nr:Metalloendopeptidase [Mycena kentingensis (nom. inval.)]
MSRVFIVNAALATTPRIEQFHSRAPINSTPTRIFCCVELQMSFPPPTPLPTPLASPPLAYYYNPDQDGNLESVPHIIDIGEWWLRSDAPSGPVNWKLFIQVSSCLTTVFEVYLAYRQYTVLTQQTQPPAALKPHVADDRFEKSRKYALDRLRFSVFWKIYVQCASAVFIHFDLLVWTWEFVGAMLPKVGFPFPSESMQTLAFMLLLCVMYQAVTIPPSLYQTFVVEERHGFNTTSAHIFAEDQGKAIVLITILVGFVGLNFWGLPRVIGGRLGSYADSQVLSTVVGLIFSFVAQMIVPMLIQPLFNKLSTLREGKVRSHVEELAKRTDGARIATRISSGFLGYEIPPPPDEVEAIFAHELGHWRHNHSIKTLLLLEIPLIASSQILRRTSMSQSRMLLPWFGFTRRTQSVIVHVLLFRLLMSPFETVFGVFMNAISRRFEWQADAYAANLLRNRRPLTDLSEKSEPEASEAVDIASDEATSGVGIVQRALINLYIHNSSALWVDWMYSAYHYSHPTLTERIGALEKLEAEWAAKEKKAL